MDVNDDVLRLILIRLPLKRLFRCKAVCKLWSSIISSGDFPFVYRRFYRRSPRLQYVGYFLYPTRTGFQHKRKPVRFYGDGTVSEEELIAGFRACSACFPGIERAFICSSNGILLCYSMKCLRSGNVLSMPGLRYYVCNPLTKEWRELPGPPSNEAGIVGFRCSEPSKPGDSGLYYEYEVVRVLIYKDEAGLSIPYRTRLEIYSSKTERWSVDEQPLEIRWNHNKYISKVIGGVIYWIDDKGHFFAYYPTLTLLKEGPMPPNVKQMIMDEQVRFSIGETVNSELVGYVGDSNQFDVWFHYDAGSDGSPSVWQKKLKVNFAGLADRFSSAKDGELFLKDPHVSQMPGHPLKALVGTPGVSVYSLDLRSGMLGTPPNGQELCLGKMYNYYYCPYHLPSWFFRL